MPKLTGKVAIVTGASRGIGRAIAVRLVQDGARVVVTARAAEALDQVVWELGSTNAASIPLDLRDADSPARLVDFTVKTFHGIDIVVNNAGAAKRGEFEQLTDEDWQDGFALKFFGAVRLTRSAWPHLKFASGSVVNIAGAGGRTPGAQFAIGGSVNAALLSLTKATADLGIRDGVQVNTINPGTIRTGRLQLRLAEIMNELQVDLRGAEEHFVRGSQITRIGEPEEVAHLVAFIVSPEGRFLQGSLIDLDGGATKTI